MKKSIDPVFSRWQKLNIFCGLNILITPSVVGLISAAKAFWNWRVGLIVALVGSVLIVVFNKKKYTLVENRQVTTFRRAVVIDSLLVVLWFAFEWVFRFVLTLEPISWASFLHQENEIILTPVTIIGALSVVPMLITNKKILNNEKNQPL